MDDETIEVRILSRMMDDYPVDKIVKQTTEDCDGDKAKAKRMIVALAKEMSD